LQNEIESADIDAQTMASPWQYICYFEGLASSVNIYTSKIKNLER